MFLLKPVEQGHTLRCRMITSKASAIASSNRLSVIGPSFSRLVLRLKLVSAISARPVVIG